MNVDPDAKTLLVGEGAVGDLDGDVSVLLPAVRHEDARIRPSPLPVDDAELAGSVGVRLDQQRLKQALVRFDLPL